MVWLVCLNKAHHRNIKAVGRQVVFVSSGAVRAEAMVVTMYEVPISADTAPRSTMLGASCSNTSKSAELSRTIKGRIDMSTKDMNDRMSRSTESDGQHTTGDNDVAVDLQFLRLEAPVNV